ncbi:MAG: hypothetical protein NTZ78_12950 [Candidatus Aureabacteria bacterium]|nr:hypothetical protein [Candidatus Auribacterota bacterium]
MQKKAALLLCLLLALVLCMCGRTYVTLENRFTRGEGRRYLLSMKLEGTTRIAGLPGQRAASESPMKIEMELAYETSVKDVNPKGIAEIETSFEQFRSLTESGEMKIRIEADEKGARLIQGETVTKDAPGLDGIRALFKNPTILTMDKRGKILSVTAPASSEALLPHTDLTSLLTQSQCLLPEGPVAVGSSWSEKRDIIPGEGTGVLAPTAKALVLNVTCTLAGIAEQAGRRCAEIKLRGDTNVANIPLQMSRTETPQETKTVLDRLNESLLGVIHFDQEKGCLLNMHTDTQQEMAMTTTPLTGEQNLKFTVETSMKISMDVKLKE